MAYNTKDCDLKGLCLQIALKRRLNTAKPEHWDSQFLKLNLFNMFMMKSTFLSFMNEIYYKPMTASVSTNKAVDVRWDVFLIIWNTMQITNKKCKIREITNSVTIITIS